LNEKNFSNRKKINFESSSWNFKEQKKSLASSENNKSLLLQQVNRKAPNLLVFFL
jgi:hypothetical protein